MSRLSTHEIDSIAQRIAASIGGSTPSEAAAPGRQGSPSADERGMGVFATVNEAAMAAKAAHPAWVAIPLDKRIGIVNEVRRVMLENAELLGKAAHSETGLGRWEDKREKNILVATKTPGPEELVPAAMTGSHGLTLMERAPWGLIGAITPTTNPTSTIINNTISMISGGNTVVFNVHPGARNVSAQNIVMINKTIQAAGGPKNVITCISTPTIETAQELMRHQLINLVVVTGGGGVVIEAMKSGKRAITAGPGNPPAVVDESADIAQAGHDIVMGSSFDNNVICTDEKETVCVASVCDDLLKAMEAAGGYIIPKSKLEELERVMFKKMAGPRGHATINRDLIGKNANFILGKMGITLPDSIRSGVIEVPEDHPMLWTEQMMPIMPVCRVPNADHAIDIAVQMEGGCRHTATMHSKNIDNLSRMARLIDCSIFVKNGRSQAGLGYGGEGPTSFTIASPTGEGMTTPFSFTRLRRCVLVDHFRIV